MIWKCTAAVLHNLAGAERDLQQNIHTVNSWLCVNLLTLSIRKSNVMLIDSRQKLRNYDLCVTVDGNQLSCVSSVRYLGLHIDETCHGISIQQTLLREFTLEYIVLTIYILCLLTFLLNYTVFLFYPYRIIVMYMDTIICATF